MNLYTQSFDQLPSTLPIFPLPNAIVMPGSYLPLNIFEPRYLNMVRDGMKGEQLIGMIQPGDERDATSLHSVGTCGRIIQYEERQNGQLGIVLCGLCRFRVTEELSTVRGYRMVVPDWEGFSVDYDNQVVDEGVLEQFRGQLKAYIDQRGFNEKWKEYVDVAPAKDLINNSVSNVELSVQDRQLLVEAPTLDDRLTAFVAAMGVRQSSGVSH